ncbi:Periplasmic binding protein [compost metagenome]
MAIGPLLAEARIASIYLSGSAALTPQVTPTGFSLYTSVDATAQTMLEYAANVRRAKSVALLTDTGAQGKASQQAFKDKVDGLGLRLTGIQEHEPHAQDLVAQLLSLRRGAPELILHVSSLGDDLGQLMTSLDQLGWEVPVASNVAGINVPMVLRVAGPGAYRKGNLAGVMLKAYTYCPGEPVGETEFGRFVGRLKAFAPQNFDKLNMQVVSMSYDSVFVLKEAVEATQSLDGPTLAAWLEEHASTIEGRVNGQLTASPSSHFLIGSDSLVMAVRPDQQRADGLVLREGCPQSGPQ